VKTLTDLSGETVAAKESMPNTVHGLASLDAPSELVLKGHAEDRLPPELKTYHVSALIVGAKIETDKDFHIVLADPELARRVPPQQVTMIAEIPAGSCVSLGRAKFFENLRTSFTAKFIAPGAGHLEKLATPAPACVKGVGFFDFLHGQTGVAKNGIELHPVLAIEKGFCR
jgi:hypothetical protein